MIFSIRVREEGTNHTWTETYDYASVDSIADATEWAHDTIDNFNADRRKGEERRELLEVTILGPSKKIPHEWEKTNLVTILEKGMRPYDTYECSECGATGKRFGLDPSIVPDEGISPYCKGDE